MPQLTAEIWIAPIPGGQRHADLGRGRRLKYRAISPKAIARGRPIRLVGSLVAGHARSAGEVILYQGRTFKSSAGIGSLGRPLARRIGPTAFPEVAAPTSWCREGIRGQVAYYRARPGRWIHQLVGGLRAAMVLPGCATVEETASHTAASLKITGAGLKESHVHDVQITRESPNYRLG